MTTTRPSSPFKVGDRVVVVRPYGQTNFGIVTTIITPLRRSRTGELGHAVAGPSWVDADGKKVALGFEPWQLEPYRPDTYARCQPGELTRRILGAQLQPQPRRPRKGKVSR